MLKLRIAITMFIRRVYYRLPDSVKMALIKSSNNLILFVCSKR